MNDTELAPSKTVDEALKRFTHTANSRINQLTAQRNAAVACLKAMRDRCMSGDLVWTDTNRLADFVVLLARCDAALNGD